MYAIRSYYAQGYLCEPHGAIAWDVLQAQLTGEEVGVFLCTAHPAKFQESVERILDLKLELPAPLAERADLPLLSDHLPVDFAAMRQYLLKA